MNFVMIVNPMFKDLSFNTFLMQCIRKGSIDPHWPYPIFQFLMHKTGLIIVHSFDKYYKNN